ncbi:MAG TPA: MauE/DoxX family redox-associated membrane protein [Edaphocola sp.]|nr:MauE/DoxX family redox-associated membrane protein [Edaphocola sp.]
MKKTKQLILILLSIFLGAFFIFSAWTKTTPNLNYFETVIHQQIGVSDWLSAIAARFFIGLEAALGLMMFLNVFGRKKWVLKACLVLLLVFSVHLVILWINEGSAVDCGCMGSVVRMNPWVSLLKNIVLIVLVWLLMRFSKEEHNGYNHVLSIIITAIIIAAPFVLFPIGPRSMPMSTLYAPAQPMSPKQELRHGKHIVCFMSLTCPHCRDAAALIHQIVEKHPEWPFYIFFPLGENDTVQKMQLKDFMAETHDRQVPYSFIARESFVDMIKAAGEDGVPTMLWMNDTVIDRKMNVPDLENTKEIEEDIQQWLAK